MARGLWTTANAGGAKPFLSNLQALRFIASLMVLVFHLDRESRLDHWSGREASIMDAIGMPWFCGVDLFFSISGFLMLYLAWEHFSEPRYRLEFLKRRFIRVAPLYWFFTLVFAVVALLTPNVLRHADLSPGALAASLLFIPFRRATGEVFPVLMLGWTLDYEVLFYGLFTLSLGLKRTTAVIVLLAGFTAATLLNVAAPPGWLPLQVWTSPIIMEFAFGIVVGWLYLHGVRLPALARVALVLLGFGLLAAAGQPSSPLMEGINGYARPLCAGLPCAMIVAGFMLGPQMRVGSWFSRAVVLGGDASYSLYLTHMFATRTLTLVWRELRLESDWGFMVAGIGLAVALAVAVFFYIETPLLAVLRRRFEPTRRLVSA